jgi:endonuclease YncB( thermonuclease family)
MKYAIAAIAALLCTSPTLARTAESVARVKDGDTFELVGHRIFGTATSIRVLGIDTPEHDYQAKCVAEKEHGIKAMLYAVDMTARAGGKVTLSKIKRDKFGGRFNARVTLKIDGRAVDWATEMQAKGFALPFTGQGPKPDWCAILEGK